MSRELNVWNLLHAMAKKWILEAGRGRSDSPLVSIATFCSWYIAILALDAGGLS